jgi:alpha-ribazole phosphatase/probable phosphoglycerate mutase
VQAQRLGKRIAHETFDAVWSSDLSRARRTAEIAFPNRNVTADPRLREIALGVFEGVARDDLMRHPPPGYAEWKRDPFRNPPPGGETGIAMRARLLDWLGGLPASGRVAAVVHAGVVRMFLYDALDDPGNGAWPFELAPTGITRLLIPPDGDAGERVMRKIRSVNDAAHLEDPVASK